MKKNVFYKAFLIALVIFVLWFIKIHYTKLGFSDVFGLVTMVVLILTLYETRAQRITSYRPKPSFILRRYYLQCNKSGIPAIWKIVPDDFYNEGQNVSGGENMFYLETINAGLGPALNVQICFDYDKRSIIKALESLSIKYSKVLQFDSQENMIQITSTQNGSQSSIKYSLYQEDEITRVKVPALLPYSVKQNFNISLPRSYVMYLSLFAYLSIEKENQENFTSPIPLIVKFTYYDTGMRKYSEKIKLRFSFFNSKGLISYNDKFYEISPNYAICDYYEMD